MVSQKIFIHSTGALLVLGGIFLGMATFGSYWIRHYEDSDVFHMGLWTMCFNISPTYTKCLNIGSQYKEELQTSRILVLIGCTGYVAAFLYCTSILLNRFIRKILGLILAAAALFLLTGLSLFTVVDKPYSSIRHVFGWSYVSGWCSAIIALIATLLCFSKRDDNTKLPH